MEGMGTFTAGDGNSARGFLTLGCFSARRYYRDSQGTLSFFTSLSQESETDRVSDKAEDMAVLPLAFFCLPFFYDSRGHSIVGLVTGQICDAGSGRDIRSINRYGFIGERLCVLEALILGLNKQKYKISNTIDKTIIRFYLITIIIWN